MCKLLTKLSNIIFPPRDTEIIVQQTSFVEIEREYHKNIFQGITYLSNYSNRTIQSAIIENKFHNNKKATFLLGRLLLIWQKEHSEKSLFIPIPLGKKRLRERGYNQVENVLKSSSDSVNFDNEILKRLVETRPQTKLNKDERLQNIKNAFVYNETKTDLTKFSMIVIVDDVVTTGATLESAKQTLSHHLPKDIKIICLALSH